MQVLVVGAGVVGLACARAAARAGHDVIVAEQAFGIGTGISSRNSEVIHAGMYYPTSSLRARHCTHGRRLLYDFCASHGVPHRKCGKLIVATNDAEAAQIAAIHAQGLKNGVENLSLIDGASARRLEPEIACVAAVDSPESGIIDGHAFMLALQGDIEDRGGVIAFGTKVESLARSPSGFEVRYGTDESVVVDAVVNSAGFGAQALARNTADYPQARVPPLVFAKGNYFSYAGRPVFSRLIYPAPVPGGLGIHVTLDLSGRMRFGPDVEWAEREDYDVDPSRAALFYERIRTYWPALPGGSLSPDYSGIRPKLSGKGEPTRDFMIDGPPQHGVAGLVHLFGIESPGLTAALSIADEAAAMIGQ
jgi:L-2-hydroxyglutarate oxidase LhgO